MSKSHKNKFINASKKTNSLICGQSDSNKNFENLHLTLNFKDLFNDNGQHHNEWDDEGLLAQVFDRLKHYCNKPMKSVYDDKFKIYPSWPPSEKTRFKIPKRFQSNYDQLKWASMHSEGKPCIIGHIIENVFYVTWFDKEHHFWLSPKKHT